MYKVELQNRSTGVNMYKVLLQNRSTGVNMYRQYCRIGVQGSTCTGSAVELEYRDQHVQVVLQNRSTGLNMYRQYCRIGVQGSTCTGITVEQEYRGQHVLGSTVEQEYRAQHVQVVLQNRSTWVNIHIQYHVESLELNEENLDAITKEICTMHKS